MRHVLLRRLLGLDLPDGDRALFGSGLPSARGWIDDVGALDVVARSPAWDAALRLGELVHLDERDVDVVCIDRQITVGRRWAIGSVDADLLIETPETTDRLPCVRLEHVIAYKEIAGRPILFTDSDTFTDLHPCTGEEHETTINFEVYDHHHENGAFVSPAVRSGTTDDGYVMENGRDILVFTGDIIVAPFMDQWRHPDGSKFLARGVFVGDFRDFRVRVDEFSLECIG